LDKRFWWFSHSRLSCSASSRESAKSSDPRIDLEDAPARSARRTCRLLEAPREFSLWSVSMALRAAPSSRLKCEKCFFFLPSRFLLFVVGPLGSFFRSV